MKFSHVLVLTVQIFCILTLMKTGQIFPSNIFLLIAAIIFFLFGVWAAIEMRFRFHFLPALLENSKLITTGPYSIVRHPIYSGTIFLTLIWIINDFTFFRFAIWLILVITLFIKSGMEEEILQGEFEDYKDYQSKTSRLIPFVF